MPQQPNVTTENNFSGGYVTDFTNLNFPPNSVIESFDCEFNLDGSVNRRLGLDFEDSYTTKTIDRSNRAITTYLWRNVSGDGDVSLLVLQVGATLYFYKTATGSFSVGATTNAISLTSVSGAPSADAVEAQFSDGNGLLFVTHPYCEPFYISYDITSDVATATTISVDIRDFEGAIADPNTVTTRPTSTLAGLNQSHLYNLYNQGWSTTNLTAWDTAQTTMPSNADVMWAFTDSSNNFAADSTTIARVFAGNTPAPKGHFVTHLFLQNRDSVAGTTGVAQTTTGHQRPSTSAFFAGRLFYAGINFSGFNSNIYFSQIVENTNQYGQCYQTNDPTAEDLFAELPSDGGVISIPEAGTIYKLITVPGGMAVFAGRGIWFITGSSAIGFEANDYTVQKIAAIKTLSASSFVDVGGYPAWWNEEGIYLMTAQGNLPQVQSLTNRKIKTYYQTIPLNSKKFSKGIYHYIDGQIRWLFRSTDTAQVTNIYEYDTVLSFNTLTGAFYLWRVSSSNVKVNSIVLSDITSGAVRTDNVVDASVNQVVDASTNTVIAFSSSGLETSPFDKYLVSYPSGGSYLFTFADKTNANYLDWFKYDSTGVNYTSYFTTGFKILGGAIRKFQSNWVRIYTKLTNPVSFFFQGLWDYATTGSGTGRWSTKELVVIDESNYSNSSRRLKVRGHGVAMQFKVESVPGEPFYITGWSALNSTNNLP